MGNILNISLGNREDLSRRTAEIFIEQIKEKPNSLICIAGGDTPLATIKYLVEAHKLGKVNLNTVNLVQLDEWVGLDEENPGSCVAYIKDNLLDKIDFPLSRFHRFDAKSKNLEEECQKAKEYINKHGGIDLILLGVGVNGHLGFNEPDTKETDSVRVVDLDSTTLRVGKKYFNANESIFPQGITLGIKEILEAKKIVVQAFGETKKGVIKKITELKVDSEYPVTYILRHDDTIVFVDNL